MAQTPALMQKARERNGFKKPDIAQFVPAEMRDAVERVTAAGMRIMFSPEMRQELMAEVNREAPMAQKLAEGTAGLVLTLDAQSKGGIPVGAIFPAAMELLGEAAGVLSAAGQQVSQPDYNEAAQLMFVILARKLGANDEQIMKGAEAAIGGQPPAGPQGAAPPQGAPPQGMPPEAMQ